MIEFTICECGMRIDPSTTDAGEHYRSAKHARAMRVVICPWCFFGAHGTCMPKRGRHWRCRCECDTNVADPLDTDLLEAFIDYLAAGVPHE